MSDNSLSWLSQTKFWILLIFTILSAICSILIFIYCFRQRGKLAIDHHVTLILVIGSFLQQTTNFPFIIDYFHNMKVFSSTNVFCLWWNVWEYSSNGFLLFVMAWGSIERHLLVFHRTLMNTRRKRIVFHFVPMFGIGLYPWVFYFAAIILNSCENTWDYDEVFCQQPCYLISYPILATYDFIADIVVPVFIITIANISLICRVLWQKRRHNAAWRRHFKLTRQLIAIASMYMLFWLPLTINGLITTFLPLTYFIKIQMNYFSFLLQLIPLSLPFLSLVSLSDFRKIVFQIRPTVVAVAAH